MFLKCDSSHAGSASALIGDSTVSGFKTPGSIWAGDMGDDRSTPFVVVLADEYLYVNFAFFTNSGRDDAVCRLEHLETPDTVLGRGTHKLSLASIKELRFSSALRLLEIYHGPSNRRFEIQSERDPIHEWVYTALRNRLAPDAEPTAGSVSRTGAMFGPICGLVLALICSALFIYWAIEARADPHNVGMRAASKNFIERILYIIGVTGTAAIATVIDLGLIGWIIYRWKHPPSAEVIRIPGLERESA
jgi:hypothetical protein